MIAPRPSAVSRAPFAREWATAWRNRAFRFQVLVSVPALVAVLLLFKRFADWVETRPGVALPDPVLAILPPVDLTWVTFIAIYLALLVALIRLIARPRQLLTAVQAYGLMVAFRAACMFVVPLDAPAGIIPLRDPFVEMFGAGIVLTRDLFFSGHTATMVLLYLTADGRGWRLYFLASSVIVGTCVTWQHVHYTADVLVAPFVAYTAYRVAVHAANVITPSWDNG